MNIVFVIIFYLIVNILIVDASYDKWCSAEELFKPSITIYKHRKGDVIVDSGSPKFYPTDDMSDLYVCINGPAWLYFARHSAIGDVYHEPQFKVYEHECQAFNGKPGHGSHTDPLILMGIYLLGEDEDYRQPSIHLFTAPLYNKDTLIYENTTSVMTINNRPCTIIKGGSTIINVSPQPDEQYSYCKMAYQNIDMIYTTPAPPGVPPPGNPAAGTVKDLFKNDKSIKKGQCEKEVDIFGTDLKTMHAQLSKKWIDYYKSVDDKCAKLNKLFDDPTKLKKPEDKTSFIDIGAAHGADSIPKEILDKEKDINDPTKTAAEVQTAKDEKKALEAKLEQAKFEHDAFEKWGKIETICDATGTARNETFENLAKNFDESVADKLASLKKKYGDDGTAYEDAVKAFKIDATKQPDMTAAEVTLNATRDKYNDEFKAVQKEIVDADKTWKNLVENINIATPAIEAYQASLTTAKVFQKPTTPQLSDVIPIFQTYDDAAAVKTNSCFPLPTVESSCSNSKPNLKRACHFLKAITDGPEICQEYENGTIPGGGALTPAADRLGKDYVEVMDLIEDIFAQACTRLDANFPKRINRIFKCYLLKPIEHGGAGFDIRDTTNNKKDVEFKGVWHQIKQALVNCKSEKRRLIFKRDPSDSDRKTYKLWLRNATGGYLADIHLHKEQADLQFPFNFAIDMHFKIFATVMGLCMASATYVNRNSYITPVFFSKYTDLFFMDLEAEWTDPRDNKIFNLILGNYKKGAGKFWANRCMEASFITSEDTNYRPPRKLYVNSHTEGNFFISGKLANTQGMYPF